MRAAQEEKDTIMELKDDEDFDIDVAGEEVEDAMSPTSKYIYIGCFKDKLDRTFTTKSKTYYNDILQRCADRAGRLGNVYFAVQAGNQCWTGGVNTATYAVYGSSDKCENGKGKGWANSVYQLAPAYQNDKWVNLGCYKDKRSSRRFVGNKEKVNNKNAIQECYDKAISRNHPYFGVESGGWLSTDCYTGSNGDYIMALGRKTGCSDGKGASFKLNVYQVKVYYAAAATGTYRDEAPHGFNKKE